MWKLIIKQEGNKKGRTWSSTDEVEFLFEELVNATDLASIVLSADSDIPTTVKIEKEAIDGTEEL